MTKTTISKPVTKTVHLGTQRYAATLTVTATGSVYPAAYGAIGVFASVVDADLTNGGSITGGYGGQNSIAGGAGVHLGAGGTITNTGLIGGGGGYQDGGIGVDLGHGGTLSNAGEISGGSAPARAGAGVVLGGGTLSNSGQIVGGMVIFQYRGTAGAGVDVTQAATVSNEGTIAGGYARYGTAGIGLVLHDGGEVVNNGKIIGGGSYVYRHGAGTAGMGVDLIFGGTLQNEGTIGGGYTGSEYSGGQGSTGVSATSAHVQNDGLIYGGNDTLNGGGTGVYLHGSILSNSATIRGGEGATPGVGLLATAGAAITNTGTIDAGISSAFYVNPSRADSAPYLSPTQMGAGVDLTAAATLQNMGVISGSDGANHGYYAMDAGSGTTGIDLTASAMAVNEGQISGGTGANSTFYGNGAIAGNGGDGAYLTTSATLTNAGTISAGAGGTANYADGIGIGGNGGAGVFINGGTLIDSGTISGAAGGHGVSHSGTAGAAVQFGSAAGTLEITRTADFDGLVTANASVNDELILTGNGVGLVIGLGTTNFTGFTTVSDVADWELRGVGTLNAAAALDVSSVLDITGTFRDAGAANVRGTLEATGAGTLLLASVNLEAGGTLSVSGQAEIVVGANLAGAKAGMILLDAGQSIDVAGTIGGAHALGIIDDATLNVAFFEQALTLLSATTGTGTINVGGGTTLTVGSSLDGPSVVFSANSGAALINAGTGSITSTLSGFSGTDSIDERRLTVTSVSFDAGTLSLLDGNATVGTLFLAGSYTSASFAVTPDGFDGTYIYLTGNDFGLMHEAHGGGAPAPALHDPLCWGLPGQGPAAGVLEILAQHGKVV